MTTAIKHWSDSLPDETCIEAVEWCRTQATFEQAWQNCGRGDWMLWLVGYYAGEPGSDARRPLVLCSCECARLALKYVAVGEDRPRVAIETPEKWARGEDGVSLDDVRSAAHAAADVANAADAAHAVAYAAYAAANAADAADAAHAVAYAAYAAANAADAAYAPHAEVYAAHAAADVADAVTAAAYAAYAAADAAHAAADVADAVTAAAYAAYAAADAAYTAYAAANARAWKLEQCADIVRKHYPTFNLEANDDNM